MPPVCIWKRWYLIGVKYWITPCILHMEKVTHLPREVRQLSFGSWENSCRLDWSCPIPRKDWRLTLPLPPISRELSSTSACDLPSGFSLPSGFGVSWLWVLQKKYLKECDWHSACYQNQQPTLINAANLFGIQHDRDTVYTPQKLTHPPSYRETSPPGRVTWPWKQRISSMFQPTNLGASMSECMVAWPVLTRRTDSIVSGARLSHRICVWCVGGVGDFSPRFGNHKRDTHLYSAPLPSLCAIGAAQIMYYAFDLHGRRPWWNTARSRFRFGAAVLTFRHLHWKRIVAVPESSFKKD